MKKMILPVLFLLLCCSAANAQDEEEKEKGFKKENLFTGGNVTASFFNKTTILGISPLFGYRFANWIDAGVVINFTYTGLRDYQEFDDKVRQTVYGGGLFTRLYPVNFLFAQAQVEYNFIKFKYIPANNSSIQPFKQTNSAPSLLLGAGYTQGRQPGSNTFFYLSLLVDVIKDENSPYVDVELNPSTGQLRVRAVPIVRAGFNIGLFEGRGRR